MIRDFTKTYPRLIAALIAGHVIALAFGLGGLLIAVPNPQLWADSDMGVRVYQFGMQYAGGLHILLATAAMLLAGIRFLGLRRTAWFFLITCVVSLSAELIGTTTGFPFGEYRYTSGLGYKILGEVPFTIPLSWFYMGLASYLLAIVLVGTGPGWKRPLTAVTGGALLLTVWDLVLDPAMAHQRLDVRFWVWEQAGIYFDMPAQNFLGWMLTGFVFIGLSRLVWGEEPVLNNSLIRVSYVVYLANLIFAMAIGAGVGLWWPVFITVAIGVLPATIALMSAEGWSGGTSDHARHGGEDIAQRVARGVMSTGARAFLAREATVRLDGQPHIPDSGPVMLLSRHFHHLLDGCVLHVSLRRPVHLVVAIDWAESSWTRQLLERACRMARWPMVIRPDAPGAGAFSEQERVRILRGAFADCVQLLSEGRIVTIFPEGYPNIDPHGSRKTEPDEFLSFDPGFVSIVRAAERRTGYQIPLVPVGFSYQKDDSGRWNIDARFGAPVYLDNYRDSESLVASITARVKSLSAPAVSTVRGDSTSVTETT